MGAIFDAVYTSMVPNHNVIKLFFYNKCCFLGGILNYMW